MKQSEKSEPDILRWLWEFSKRLVRACALIYVAVQLYAAAAMWHFQTFDYLGTMIEKSSDIMQYCVFGYMVKAGLENIVKIWLGVKKSSSDDASEEDSGFYDEEGELNGDE